jgi:hypothetical protein
MSFNKNGTVELVEIANLFICAGICRNRKVFDDLFEICETGSGSEEGFISFTQFLSTIETRVLSRRLFVNSLDSFIIDNPSLSADTVVIQERRKLLMQHIVHKPAVRAWGIDHASDNITSASAQRRQYRKTKMQSLSELTGRYAKERADSAEVVYQLEDILHEERDRSRVTPASAKPVSKPLPVLLPLEDLLSKELLAYVDSSITSLARASFDRGGNLSEFTPATSESDSQQSLPVSPMKFPQRSGGRDSTESTLPVIRIKNKIRMEKIDSFNSEDVSCCHLDYFLTTLYLFCHYYFKYCK